MAQITVATSMTYFTFVTALAFVLKFYMAKSYSARNQSIFSLIITVVYLAIILFIQLYVNYQNAKEKCGGTPQLVASINYTLIPNLFIFGTFCFNTLKWILLDLYFFFLVLFLAD